MSEAVATHKEDTEVAEQGTSHHRMTSKKNAKAYFICTYILKISCKKDQLVLIIICLDLLQLPNCCYNYASLHELLFH